VRLMTFAEEIRQLVSLIPPGQVASYGQLALIAGHPRAARMVGYVMRGKESFGLPCHRVIQKDGSLCPPDVFGGPGMQRGMLEAEGVLFLPDGRVDMAACRWPGP